MEIPERGREVRRLGKMCNAGCKVAANRGGGFSVFGNFLVSS